MVIYFIYYIITMKFNIGDKVRLTRKWIIRHLSWTNTTVEDWMELMEKLINWFEIKYRYENLTYWLDDNYNIKEEHLELVEDEFSLGQQVEVSDGWEKWIKLIYVKTVIHNWSNKYITASPCRWSCTKNDSVYFNIRKYIRKIRDKLTRKEIAEKFGVNEDFIIED